MLDQAQGVGRCVALSPTNLARGPMGDVEVAQRNSCQICSATLHKDLLKKGVTCQEVSGFMLYSGNKGAGRCSQSMEISLLSPVEKARAHCGLSFAALTHPHRSQLPACPIRHRGLSKLWQIQTLMTGKLRWALPVLWHPCSCISP